MPVSKTLVFQLAVLGMLSLSVLVGPANAHECKLGDYVYDNWGWASFRSGTGYARFWDPADCGLTSPYAFDISGLALQLEPLGLLDEQWPKTARVIIYAMADSLNLSAGPGEMLCMHDFTLGESFCRPNRDTLEFPEPCRVEAPFFLAVVNTHTKVGWPPWDDLYMFLVSWCECPLGRYEEWYTLDTARTWMTPYPDDALFQFSWWVLGHTGKSLKIQDNLDNRIPLTTFSFIRITSGGPTFAEDTLGTFTTDDHGYYDFTIHDNDNWYFMDEQSGDSTLVQDGDIIKIGKAVSTEPAVRHPGLLGTMYSIHLDNARIDENGSMSFDTLNTDGEQKIVLNHTEYRYNLLVSIEWDAAVAYQQGLQEDFPQISNYLYDVTDGQVRLDTVAIVDNGELWDMADMRIRASNCHNPNSKAGSITAAGWYPITMPRKWFGDSASSRYQSYVQHPLGVSLSNDWRAKAHEFGHYALGFFDEYLFVDGGGHRLPETARCEPWWTGNYGFMDYEYDNGGIRSSEMSSQYRYQNPSCQNTEQWVLNGSLSCWDYWESRAQRTINGLYIPIRKPDQGDTLEHLTPPGLDYIRGPNDNLILLDYDVGRLVYFASTIMPPDPVNRSLNLHVDGVPVGGCEVTLKKPLSAGGFRYLDQGKTRNDGLIWVLGASGPDHLQTYGHNYTIVNPAKGTAFAGISRQWLTASLDLSTVVGDSVSMTLQPIEGDYPLVLLTDISQDPQRWRLEYTQPFSQLPTLEFLSGSGQPMTPSVTELNGGYDATPDALIASEGQARLEAVDVVGHSFFVPFSYIRYDITESSQLSKLLGPNATAILSLSSDNNTTAKALIAASSYPPILTGLEADAIQAGDAYSTSVSPSVTLTGTNNLTILYTDDDLQAGNSLIGDESLLQIYRWDEGGNSWQLVGGIVDTVRNEVTAPITELGTYAAFTTDSGIGSDCGDADSDGMITIADVVFLVEYIFVHGAAPNPLATGDADCSGDINIADCVYLVSYIFSHGPQPCAACK